MSTPTAPVADDALLRACTTSLDQDLCTLDTEYDRARSIRNTVIDKLYAEIMIADVKLDNKDPDQLAAQMSAIKVLDDLINGQEKNTLNRAKMKLNKTAVDTVGSIGLDVRSIAESLNNMGTITDTQFEQNQAKNEQLIQEAFELSGSVIIPEELMTDNDVSILSETMNVTVLNRRADEDE